MEKPFNQEQKQHTRVNKIGEWAVIGLTLGTVIGFALDIPLSGLVVGLVTGLAIGFRLNRQ